MLSFPKSLIAIGLLSTAEGARLGLSSQEVATLLEGNNETCPVGDDNCMLSWNRLHAGNNNVDYLKYSKQNTQLYKDPTFPAGPGSLFWTTQMQPLSVKYERYVTTDIAWARPSEMQSTDPNLWGTEGETRPSAAQQGGLGDCWFLAAASALAEFPDRIKKIFTNTGYSNVGVFQTKFMVQGEEIRVTVDDRLPASKAGGDTTSTRLPSTILSRKSPTGSWWLPILEKSFAKLNVNYANLNGGWMTEAWRQMTGQPVVWLSTKGKMTTEEIWTNLSEWDRKNYVISTACFSGANGLVSGHAYSIIGVKTITLADGTTQRLVQARNPWGSEGYSGNWSDKSDLWTDDTKEQVGLKPGNDGIFYIPVEEFLEDFQELQYIAYQDDWKTSTAAQFSLENQQSAVGNINVKSDKNFHLQCDQVYPRLYPSGCKQANQLTYAAFTLYGPGPDGGHVGSGNCYRGTKNTQFKGLAPGDYKIKITNYSSGKIGKYSMTTYAEDEANTISFETSATA